MTLKAPVLREGDGIGIVAPAGPVEAGALHQGMDLLEDRGFRLHLGDHLFDRGTYLAGGDTARRRDFEAMVKHPDVRAIFCARGGYGSLRLLEDLDYDLMAHRPKILLGYSDITALLLAVYAKTSLITFHGPMVRDLAGEGRTRDLDFLLSLLTGRSSFPMTVQGDRSLREGRATGTLLGGNLSLLSYLVGTPYLPSMRGAVLFIEDRSEPPYKIDRMMTHLRLSGLLSGLRAVVLGSFTDCGPRESVESAVLDALPYLDIPILSGVSLGHGPENKTLPIGGEVLVDTTRLSLTVLDPPLMMH